MNPDAEEQTIQTMMGKPLLAVLLAVFQMFDIAEGPFLKSVAGFAGWTEIVEAVLAF